MGRPIIGTSEVIAGLTRADLMDFYRTHYNPGKITVAVAGNISHEHVMEKLRSIFETKKSTTNPRLMTAPLPSSKIMCRYKDTGRFISVWHTWLKTGSRQKLLYLPAHKHHPGGASVRGSFRRSGKKRAGLLCLFLSYVLP